MILRRNPAEKSLRHPAKRLDLILESTIASIDKAETLVVRFCKPLGCGEHTCHEIGMAVRESVTNAILHGNGRDPSKKVSLEAEIRREGIVISVRDEGEGFDPESLPDPCDLRNLLRESGRGIFLLKALMDEVILRHPPACGMEVTMVKHLPKMPRRRA